MGFATPTLNASFPLPIPRTQSYAICYINSPCQSYTYWGRESERVKEREKESERERYFHTTDHQLTQDQHENTIPQEMHSNLSDSMLNRSSTHPQSGTNASTTRM